MVVAGVVALATAPAAIAQEQRPLAWFDAEAGVSAAVDFADVAASGSTVVAVGSKLDDATKTATAAIYSWDGSGWTEDPIDAAVGAGSQLTDVSIAGTEAWAVGTSASGPLVLRRGAGGWVPQVTSVTSTPTAVAAGASTAVIGDSEGKLHRVPADGEPDEALGAGAISDISLHTGSAGFAVARWDDLLAPTAADDTTARIYALAPEPQPQLARSGTERVDMLGVAAVSAGQAVAIDSTKATWRLQDGTWQQDPVLPATELSAVAALPDARAGYVHEMVAGAGPTDGESPASGAIWHRHRLDGRYEPWQSAALPDGTAPLAGVVITGPESAWAVGDDGTILRFWRKPPTAEELEAERLRLAAEEAERQRLADEQAERERLAEEQRLAEEERLRQEELARQQQEQAAQQQAPAEEPPAEESTAAPAPPPPPAPERDQFDMNGIVIDDSTAPKPGQPDTGQRLLKNVKAVRKGRKLIVSFRLTAKARVALTAKRGRRVVARTRMQTLRKGRRTLVLRFRGRPPSSLKVTVRRVSAGANN